ncbi:MAG: isoaspartyl peptidase/L-asparaginase, partial [Candidatus Dormiibacterota bacterium]
GGTVGAVCRDASGELAVAVSTGGMDGKLPGRIGDTAICGAGFYADSPGAACATGQGEAFIRILGCRLAVELMASGMDAQAAATQVIDQLAARVDGRGGIILVDAMGRPGSARNTPDMPWAWRTETATASW